MQRIFAVLALLFASCSASAQNSITDPRDGTQYEIFQVGEHLWFKENLKYKTPTSWCQEHPDSEACQTGNYYYPTDLINVCPSGWSVPTWSQYRKAIKEIEVFYNLTGSMRYEESEMPNEKFKLRGESVGGLTLINDTTFFDMGVTGWIEGDKWVPQSETTMWIIDDVSNTPQPHIHIREKEIIMHSHTHNVIDKPKKLRRFSVRCVSKAN